MMRNRLAASALAGLLVACAPMPQAPPPKAVAKALAMPNADLEMPVRADGHCAPHWGCSGHAGIESYRFAIDTTAPAQGRQSLCIERVRPEPWALVTQSLDARALQGKRVRFSLQVRMDDVAQGAGPWVVVRGAQGNNLLHDQKLAGGTRGWQRMALDFDVARDAQSVEVGATLEGPGRACIDDARLEIL